MPTPDSPQPVQPPAVWYPLQVGHNAGYVILSRPAGHPPTDTDPGAYWCGHAGWDAFATCLESLDLYTRQLRPAAIAVYPQAWDAVRSWHAWLADHHRRHGRPFPAAFEVVPLSMVGDRSRVPLWQQLHPVSTADAARLRRAHPQPAGGHTACGPGRLCPAG